MKALDSFVTVLFMIVDHKVKKIQEIGLEKQIKFCIVISHEQLHQSWVQNQFSVEPLSYQQGWFRVYMKVWLEQWWNIIDGTT